MRARMALREVGRKCSGVSSTDWLKTRESIVAHSSGVRRVPALEGIDEDREVPPAELHDEPAREPDPHRVQAGPPGDLAVDHGEDDGQAPLALQHLVEEAIAGVGELGLARPLQPFLLEEDAVQGLQGGLVWRPRSLRSLARPPGTPAPGWPSLPGAARRRSRPGWGTPRRRSAGPPRRGRWPRPGGPRGRRSGVWPPCVLRRRPRRPRCSPLGLVVRRSRSSCPPKAVLRVWRPSVAPPAAARQRDSGPADTETRGQ